MVCFCCNIILCRGDAFLRIPCSRQGHQRGGEKIGGVRKGGEKTAASCQKAANYKKENRKTTGRAASYGESPTSCSSAELRGAKAHSANKCRGMESDF